MYACALRAAQEEQCEAPAACPPPAPLTPLSKLGISILSDFLSPEEVGALVASIDAFPQRAWAELTHRRLLNLGGVPHPCGSWAEPLPPALMATIGPRLRAMGLFGEEGADQILLNEYTRGAGIGAHKDGPCFQPCAAILSLGGDAVLRFSRESAPLAALASVIMKSGSLVVFQNEAYNDFYHYIEACQVDALDETVLNREEGLLPRPARRLSLTLRKLAHVQKRFTAKDPASAEEEAERKRRNVWWLNSISEKETQ
jgi:alkylated DNA repair protein alkB family protein 6